ncbi:MAG: aldo/keto reductase, partial [Bacteroidota bacterium]
MHYKRLGNSGLIVSDLCLGTMIFGEEGPRSTSAADATRMIHRFLDAGGNFVDTADAYAGGRSEEIVGQAVKSRRGEVIVATKVRFPTGGRNDQGLSRHHIIRGVHASLKRLDTDVIDVLYVHCWDPFTPIEETMRALDDLVTQGHVRYLGVSNFKAWQVMKALGLSEANGYARFIAGQYQYSLVQRDIEYEFDDLCATEGIGLTPWGPLGGGFLTGKYKRGEQPSEGRIATATEEQAESWARRATERNWRVIDAVGEIAEKRGMSYAQVALAWLRAKSNVSSVIIGARTMEQLDDNLGAADLSLTPEEMDALDTASRLPELYPYIMIETYGRRSL